MTVVRQVARGAAVMVLMRIGAAALAFTFFAVAARHWGASRLGQLAMMLAWWVLLQPLPLLGLHLRLVRDLAQSPDHRGPLTATTTVIGLGTAVVGVVVVSCAPASLLNADLRLSAILLAASLVPSAVIAVGESEGIAMGTTERVARITLTETLLRTLAWTAIVVYGGTLTTLFLVLLVGRSVTAVVYASTSPGLRAAWSHRHLDGAMFRDFIGSVPALLTIVVLSGLMTRLDMLLLGELGGAAVLGMYAAAYRLVEGVSMLPQALTLVLYPRISASAACEGSLFDVTHPVVRLLHQATLGFVQVGAPATLCLSLSAPWVVPMVFGPAFAPASAMLTLLAPIPMLLALDQSWGATLLALHRSREDAMTLVLAVGAYAIALLTLVPTWQGIGAAMATLVATAVQLGAKLHLLRQHVSLAGLGAPIGRTLLTLVLAMISSGMLRDFGPVIRVLAPVAVYCTLGALFGVLPLRLLQTMARTTIDRPGHETVPPELERSTP